MGRIFSEMADERVDIVGDGSSIVHSEDSDGENDCDSDSENSDIISYNSDSEEDVGEVLGEWNYQNPEEALVKEDCVNALLLERGKILVQESNKRSCSVISQRLEIAQSSQSTLLERFLVAEGPLLHPAATVMLIFSELGGLIRNLWDRLNVGLQASGREPVREWEVFALFEVIFTAAIHGFPLSVLYSTSMKAHIGTIPILSLNRAKVYHFSRHNHEVIIIIFLF